MRQSVLDKMSSKQRKIFSWLVVTSGTLSVLCMVLYFVKYVQVRDIFWVFGAFFFAFTTVWIIKIMIQIYRTKEVKNEKL
jgi:hypothetical protein